MKRLLRMFVLLAVLFTLAMTESHSREVTARWNPVESADGYKIYYGTESQEYAVMKDLGNTTIAIVRIDPGTYYFVVTAYNMYGESGYSEEVAVDVDYSICDFDKDGDVDGEDLNKFSGVFGK